MQKSKGINYPKIKLAGTEQLILWAKDVLEVKSSAGKYSSIAELSIFGSNARLVYEKVKNLDVPLMDRKWVVLK